MQSHLAWSTGTACRLFQSCGRATSSLHVINHRHTNAVIYCAQHQQRAQWPSMAVAHYRAEEEAGIEQAKRISRACNM